MWWQRRARRGAQVGRRGLVAAIAVGIVALVVFTHGGSNGRATPSGEGAAKVPASLTGTFHAQSDYLTIRSDGSGSFSWPTYTYCGTGPGHGPPPCDQLVPNANGAGGSQTIVDGGRAQLHLLSVRGTQASGIVTQTTQPSVLPDGSVEIRLATNDVLYLTTATKASVPAFAALCGAAANALTVSQQKVQGIDCSA